MEEIMTIPIELEQEAERISSFRSKMKAYLTRFGTLNQIDNYETKVADYQPLFRMLNIYYGYIK
jgi:hypothetical protein